MARNAEEKLVRFFMVQPRLFAENVSIGPLNNVSDIYDYRLPKHFFFKGKQEKKENNKNRVKNHIDDKNRDGDPYVPGHAGGYCQHDHFNQEKQQNSRDGKHIEPK